MSEINNTPLKVTNPKPSKEILEALKEANEMINNPKKYPRYSNRKDLKKALLAEKNKSM